MLGRQAVVVYICDCNRFYLITHTVTQRADTVISFGPLSLTIIELAIGRQAESKCSFHLGAGNKWHGNWSDQYEQPCVMCIPSLQSMAG
jgi:hypothetical protein